MILENKIYNVDCLEGLRELPDKSIDLIVTDPPYINDTVGGGFCKTRKYISDIKPLSNGFSFESIYPELIRVMKKINIYIFCSQSQIKSNLDFFCDKHDCGFELLTWHKTNPLPACNNKYLSDTEYILYFRERGVKIFGNYSTKKKYFITGTNSESKKFGHPTVKPLNIIQTLIFNSSSEGDIILDPFIGSGTTAVAAMKEKRKYLGFEIEPKYFQIANKRIIEEQNQLNLF